MTYTFPHVPLRDPLMQRSQRVLVLGLAALVASGCVVNRTGQSATGQMEKELAEHQRRVNELEAGSEDVSRRVGQLEEVTRSRGQEDILRMDTMEQLRQEVANARGDFEVLQHDYSTFEAAGLGYQQDADWRMGYLELRVANLEKSLGVRAPPPPSKDGSEAAAVSQPTGVAVTSPPPVAPEAPLASTPDEYFALITQNLQDGKGAAARAVAQRFIRENPKSDRVAEALYRIAESYQNESDFVSSVQAFQAVIDAAGTSTWAPWSMLRQGECMSALGRPDDAKVFWRATADKYPKSKAAKEARTHLTTP